MTSSSSPDNKDSSPTSTQVPQTTPPLPVDRDWIKKLLYQHSENPNNGKALVVAPMVDQSDYPFRVLCRQYGANLAFTPMIHSGMLVRSPAYQSKFIPNNNNNKPNDRPLIAQLCGHDPDTLEQAARLMAPHCDGIDLNCGCPQGIAKRGFYGAFLLEDETTLLNCVRRLVQTIAKPISVKVRLLPGDPDKSLELYRQLINDCGIHLLTIHGRTRHQLHVHTGAADWTMIKRVVNEFGHKIPIFANGNIGSMADVEQCFAETGADGVMSSEAILEYPALFAGDSIRIGRIQLAKEYLQLAKQYPPDDGNQGNGMKTLKAHMHRFLHPDLEAPEGSNHVLRRRVAGAEDWQSLWDTVEYIGQMQQNDGHKVEDERLSWYMRHRMNVTDAHGNAMTSIELKRLSDQGVQVHQRDDKDVPEDDDSDVMVAACMFDVEDFGDY